MVEHNSVFPESPQETELSFWQHRRLHGPRNQLKMPSNQTGQAKPLLYSLKLKEKKTKINLEFILLTTSTLCTREIDTEPTTKAKVTQRFLKRLNLPFFKYSSETSVIQTT